VGTAGRNRLPAVFLDRDGTLIEEKGYVHRVEDVSFLPGAVEAVRLLNGAGLKVVVVTNQAGVAWGYYSEEDVYKLHEYISQSLSEKGAFIDAWYFCPHHPEGSVPQYRQVCQCRKPRPGLLCRAAKELNLDLRVSFMVGDKVSDLAAGSAAGCRSILVLTGYGLQEQRLANASVVVPDVLAAAQTVLRNSGSLHVRAGSQTDDGNDERVTLKMEGDGQNWARRGGMRGRL
jgi:D-glycero-D-manno-heptose 1,7-bisphosphate phosphatase